MSETKQPLQANGDAMTTEPSDVYGDDYLTEQSKRTDSYGDLCRLLLALPYEERREARIGGSPAISLAARAAIHEAGELAK